MWDDAVLMEAFPSTSTVYGVLGDRLPNSARFSGRLSLQQDFRITGRLTGFAWAAVSYVCDRVGTFKTTLSDNCFLLTCK
jgi:iron complex outermembrane recepter protein